MPKTSITGALITIDIRDRGSEPLHRQVANHLRESIGQGRLPAGAKLPSTRVFAKELGVSRNTILQVFETLIEEGYLTGRVGAGTFVAHLHPEGPHETAKGAGSAAGGDAPAYPFRTLSRRGKSMLRSATSELTERPRPFMPDLPDLREFPIRTWLRLLGENSGRLTGSTLASIPNAGFEPLRRAIAQHLNTFRGLACDHHQVIITTGSQQSLDLVSRLLLDPGDPVWIEEPGYVGARTAIGVNGGAIYPIPVDADGIRVDVGKATTPVPRMVFTSPARHYPLGATLSLARRSELIRLAQECGSWIIEDDYDSEFRYVRGGPPALHSLDTQGRTIYIGSFSKILLPSFRLGYMVVPSDFAEVFAKARATIDRHSSLIEQMALAEFMQRDLLGAHIRRMRVLYRSRQQELVRGLGDLFGGVVSFAHTDTGMHVILPLHADADDVQLTASASAARVVVRPLSPYYAGRTRAQGLLLGFSAFTSGEIGQALRRLEKIRDQILPVLAREVLAG